MREPEVFPPDWAVAYGDDRHGLWAEFAVGDVRQRMRWIVPGEFLMGSPDDEPGRSSGEGPQHRVRISRGFWLADTACTQALWLAVMGPPNPSRFADDVQNPVERVSWDDVTGFLERLAQRLPGAAEAAAGPPPGPAGLPTEAEWEYACRAGRKKAFNLGPNITPEQVNYYGTFPYHGAPKGEYRGRPVPVRSFEPNRWGLYQMHGNVWEWCADGQRRYEVPEDGEALEDPQGPAEPGPEAHRCVRGGSWFSRARNARSAYRNASQRGHRSVHLGFRLALRS